jgi:MFS transporter, PPP family, 3-phenylpropionic acid transporter
VPRDTYDAFPVRAQFFLTYAVMGSLLPFLSLYLWDRKLTEAQIGYVTAASALGPVLTPGLVTLLADAAFAGRRLMTAVFLVSGLAIATLLFVRGFWPILLVYALHALAFAPVVPLQDGIHFAAQRRRAARGLPTVPYHVVRVWGTVGFICPGVVLYFFLRGSGTVAPALIMAASACALALLNTFTLPDTAVSASRGETAPNGNGLAPSPGTPGEGGGEGDGERRATSDVRNHPHPNPLPEYRERGSEARTSPSPAGNSPVGATAPPAATRLPTTAALRAMIEPHVLVFCIAMGLVAMASACFYQFYAIYLTQELKVDKAWVGLIQNIGVVGEIFFMLAFGWLLRTLTLRWLVILGVACVLGRMVLLAAIPSVWTAVLTQLVHGMTVLAMMVAPPVFLNAHAGDAFRNSMQGLYTMAVQGTSRILGSLVAGQVAERAGLLTSFWVGAGFAAVALALLFFAFHEKHAAAREATATAAGLDRPPAPQPVQQAG